VKPTAACRLYTFIDAAYLSGRDPADIARQLCEGGSDLVQLRAKGYALDTIRKWADSIRPVLESFGVGLVINDHPRLAVAVGAPYCHLGQEDFFDAGYTHTSQVAPEAPDLRIGLSTHAPEQALRGLQAAPDYIAIGPVFATPTKPGRPAVTLDYVRWAAAHVSVPWFAIGGINLDNLEAVLAAGATRICVVSAILQERDIAKACGEFRRRLPSAPHNS